MYIFARVNWYFYFGCNAIEGVGVISKERELLVKAWNLLIYLMGGKIGDGISSINRKFLYELKEYISQPEQPEQTEQEPCAINENTSDGYHTFKELYEFRKAYNVALFNEWGATGKCYTHKSWRHNNGELCFGGGWFIVVAVLPKGQISNHYEAKDWDLFTVPEVEKALFEFDGHTGADVVERLKLYTSPPSRKPLNIEHILGRLDFNDNFEYRDGFIDGVLWAEQQHGIGGGE